MQPSRFGKTQRAMLLAAANGPALISQHGASTNSYRAARALVARGLARFVTFEAVNASLAWRAMRHLELTAAGLVVEAAFRPELEARSKIRWHRLPDRIAALEAMAC